MTEKYKKRIFTGSLEDAEKISLEYGIELETAKSLIMRGLTVGNARSFFSPALGDFHDPLLMHGMNDAVKAIKGVTQSGGRVLIYGDYDADGVTASAILKLFFDSVGVKSRIVLPTRDHGYGLHYPLVENAYFSEAFELLVTVDVGISAREDVEQITQALGVKVVVTDHHNPPEVLPDCVCVNPKLGYVFKELCGAGVALKLVHALSDVQTAARYLTLAAIGTAGDVCPVCDENRLIMKLGTQNVKHRGILKLAEYSKSSFSYGDLCMKLVPRINSAGRMGSPEAALAVVLSEKLAREKDVEELCSVNEERYAVTREVVADIEDRLDKQDGHSRGNAIILADERWHKGIIGIAASRVKELYNMPAFIFRREGDEYRGSARSIEGIDIHAALKGIKSVKSCGGHALSMGFTVQADRFGDFCREVNDRLSDYRHVIENYTQFYDLDFEPARIAKYIESRGLVQPCGELLFHIRARAVGASTFGAGKNVSIFTDHIELKGFSRFSEYLPALKTGAEFEALFTVEYDAYSKRNIGVLRDLTILNSLRFESIFASNYLLRARTVCADDRAVTVNAQAENEASLSQTLREFFLKNKESRAEILLNSFEEYEDLTRISDGALSSELEKYSVDFFKKNKRSGRNATISPSEYVKTDIAADFDLPLCSSDAKLRLIRGVPPYMKRKLTREMCVAVFNDVKDGVSCRDAESYFLSRGYGEGTDFVGFLIILRVFEELGFISLKTRPLEIKPLNSRRKSLEESAIFGALNLTAD